MQNNPLADASYTCSFRVPFKECDMMQRPKPSALLGWMVDIAGDDYEARGFPREKLLENKQVFLLSRAAYQIYRMPRYDETLTVRTWEVGLDTIFFSRGYAFYDAAHTLCVGARSTWLLCDPASHRILRPRTLCVPSKMTGEEPECFPDAQLTPFEGGDDLGEYRVLYTDLDANGHLFSAVYGDIAHNFLPAERQSLPYRGMIVNYIKEARLNETLHLFGCASDDHYDLIARHADGMACFAARYLYGETE